MKQMILGFLVILTSGCNAQVALRPHFVLGVEDVSGMIAIDVEQPYTLQATKADVKRIGLVLKRGTTLLAQTEIFYNQEAKIGRKFLSVSPGKVVISGTALDINKTVIGEGTAAEIDVEANLLTVVPLKIKLKGNTGTPGVNILFEEATGDELIAAAPI